jgi:hypothetical protein
MRPTRPGVSNMRPARCVCAARDIIKITQIIAKTTVFGSIGPILYYRPFQPPIVARGDIFPVNAAREPFFVKMWPACETEFETPALDLFNLWLFILF